MDSGKQDGYDGHGGEGHWYGGYGQGQGNWVWWVVIVIIIIIIICCLAWWAWSSNPRNGQGGNSKQGIRFKSTFSASQEVPLNMSGATGNGAYLLTGGPQSLNYEVNISGLSQLTAAHFHLGNSGTNGPVIKTLDAPVSTGNGSYRYSGIWGAMDTEPLTPERVQQLINGEIYVNIHTMPYPDGEIRGQVLRE